MDGQSFFSLPVHENLPFHGWTSALVRLCMKSGVFFKGAVSGQQTTEQQPYPLPQQLPQLPSPQQQPAHCNAEAETSDQPMQRD